MCQLTDIVYLTVFPYSCDVFYSDNTHVTYVYGSRCKSYPKSLSMVICEALCHVL